MTMLSRKVDYSLLILSHLHQHPVGASAQKIAAAFDLSRPFVANILKVLCQKGFVESRRGVKGGYALLRPAAEIHLAELMDALDEPFQLTTCTGSGHDSGDNRCGVEAICPVRHPLAGVHERIRDLLRRVTLDQLFARTPAVGTAEGNTQFGLTLSGLARPLVGQTP